MVKRVNQLENGKILRSVGLKVTSPRIKILKLLESSVKTHLTAEDIFKELLKMDDDISLATIYRALSQFEEAGLVIKHNFDGINAVYELNTEDHHDHMVCLKTGDIIEFYNEDIEKKQQEIAEKHGYEVINHSLILYVRPKTKNK
jgi:Fur family ferric uptake transcriptional regulator